MMVETERLVGVFGNAIPTIKVPCTPDGLQVCRYLRKEGLRVPMSHLFSLLLKQFLLPKLTQHMLRSSSADVTTTRLQDWKSSVQLRKSSGDKNVRTRVLSASIRDVYKVTRSFYNGANIVTIPPAIFHKMYNHVLTDAGMQSIQSRMQVYQKTRDSKY